MFPIPIAALTESRTKKNFELLPIFEAIIPLNLNFLSDVAINNHLKVVNYQEDVFIKIILNQ